MIIALIANDSKKELMVQFCIAYCGELAKHRLSATAATGKLISEATGLSIDSVLSGRLGGIQQIASMAKFNEIDILLYFRDNKQPASQDMLAAEDMLFRQCDQNNILYATNHAMAETLIWALSRGELDWRDIMNPISAYNLKNKNANGKQ